jgi:hypothetical protein
VPNYLFVGQVFTNYNCIFKHPEEESI